jgi:hypothetical protein
MILHHLEKEGYPWVTLTGYPYWFGLEAYFFRINLALVGAID